MLLITAAAVCVLGGAGAAWLLTDDGDDGPAPAPTTTDARVTTLDSRPDLRPPRVTVKQAGPAGHDRLVLVTPRAGPVAQKRASHQQGPMILDQAGRVVWFKSLADGSPATDLEVQTYQGEPVLTWWQGPATASGSGNGEAVIVDRSYETVATVEAGNGYGMDLHEFHLTDRDTALVTIYHRERRDLSAIGGGTDAQVTEGVVQEIDVATGKVLFEWHSLDHVTPSESDRPVPTAAEESFDYFHVNSVEEDGRNRLLISARNTSTIYEVDKRTGEVLWRLGGKRSDFTMAAGTHFALQHDARRVAADEIQLFDNEDQTTTKTPSSALVLRLDRTRMRATAVRRVPHPDGLAAESQGSVQALPDGGLFIGWGSTAAFSRVDADRSFVFDALLPSGYDTYRARLQAWSARPDTAPAVSATGDDGKLRVAVSWNGATDVASWQVLAGESGSTTLGAPVAWAGLETTFSLPATADHVRVRALDADGRTLATSAAVAVS
jgi:hypothetical protein